MTFLGLGLGTTVITMSKRNSTCLKLSGLVFNIAFSSANIAQQYKLQWENHCHRIIETLNGNASLVFFFNYILKLNIEEGIMFLDIVLNCISSL